MLEKYTINSIQKFIRAIILMSEMILLTLIFHFLLRQALPGLSQDVFHPKVLVMYSIGILLWISVATFFGYNDQEGFFNPRFMLKWGIVSITFCAGGFGLVVMNLDFLPNHVYIPLVFALAVTLSTFPIRYLFVQAYKYRRIFLRNSRIMIIGNGKAANDLNDFFARHKASKLIHLLNGETVGMSEPELLSLARMKVPEIKQIAIDNQVGEIYWNLPLAGTDILEEVGEFAYNHFISFKIASGFNYLDHEGQLLGFINNKPIITLRNPPLASFSKRQIKRAFDLVFSSLILLLVFPWLALLIGIAIKLDSPGPVFFVQPRAGRKNKIFQCIKFRTMSVAQEQEGFRQAEKNDARITRVGKFLRRNNLDEVPQFLNVLLGDMSVIGPRPHPPKLDQDYVPMIKYYQYRYFIKPGISGWAQIHGFRGETKVPERMMKRIEYDNWYIENWDLWLDLRIVLRTTLNMVTGEENAY